MWEELIPTLPTRMRELHAWYMKASATKDVCFRARIQDRHSHRGMTYGFILNIFMICTIKTPLTSLSSVYFVCKCTSSYHLYIVP